MNIHNFLGRPVFFRTRCSPHGLEHGFRRLEDIDDALNAQPPQLTFPVVGTDAARLKKGVVHLEVSYHRCKFHMHQQHYQTCLRMSIAPMQVPTYETLHCDECLWRCAQMSRALEPCLIRQVLRIDVVQRRKH